MKNVFLYLAVMATLFISACGGSSSSSKSTPTSGSIATKGVMYPVVVGLSYQTNSSSGVVASDGSYTYKANENVTFSAGGIELATVPAAAKVTPLLLDDDVASKNLLRLLKALDTDGDLSNGISLSQLATSSLTSVDLTSEASVAATLASLAPAATLPAASDVQVETALADTKTTALQNMGTYGSTYKAIRVTQHNGSPLPGYPKNAVINLTSQPNWTTGAITGTAILTLNDNSTITLPFNNTNGNYTASGVTFAYSIDSIYGGKSRVIAFSIGLATTPPTGKSVGIVLRDNSQPNIPPVAAAYGETTFPLSSNVPRVTTLSSIPTDQGFKMQGSWDTDGLVVSQVWTSSKGKTGTGNTFSEGFLYNEKGSITLTVTDDEGKTAFRTWQCGSNSTAGTVPTVNSISPAFGIVGTTVTITGTNFTTANFPAASITFSNGVTASGTNLISQSATQLVVKVPAGAVTGPVTIQQTPGGASITTNSFSVGSGPSVTGISPTTGVSGTVVKITGTNFSTTPANNTVKFNGTLTTVTAATATSLTVTVPSGATTGTVSVATTGGTATSAGTFTVTAVVATQTSSITMVDYFNGTTTATIIFDPTKMLGPSASYKDNIIWRTSDDSADFTFNTTSTLSVSYNDGFWVLAGSCISNSVGCTGGGATYNRNAGTLHLDKASFNSYVGKYAGSYISGDLYFKPVN